MAGIISCYGVSNPSMQSGKNRPVNKKAVHIKRSLLSREIDSAIIK
jgi:hypothetical protein